MTSSTCELAWLSQYIYVYIYTYDFHLPTLCLTYQRSCSQLEDVHLPIFVVDKDQELGGGTWSRPMASFMTKWRLIPNVTTDRLWRLLELELFVSWC
jgi:hypothetical protein